jgi:hypothetical protein
VFPVQLLERYHQREDQKDSDHGLPLPELEDDPDEYELEEIRDKKTIRGQIYYLVKWTSWPSEYNQWVPEEDMANAHEMVRSFEKSRRGKRRHQDNTVIDTGDTRRAKRTKK